MLHTNDELMDMDTAQAIRDSAKSMSLDMYADLLEAYANHHTSNTSLALIARELRDCGTGMDADDVRLVVLNLIADELGVQP